LSDGAIFIRETQCAPSNNQIERSVTMSNNAPNDDIAIKTAKRAVLNNIKWLEARIATLDTSSAAGKQLLGFYANKIDAQQMVFEWLNSSSVPAGSASDRSANKNSAANSFTNRAN
jgi:hypothetical protein